MRIPFVTWSYGNCGIAKHCFGACCRNNNVFAFFALDRVAEMPESALNFLVLDLGVGNNGVAVWADVGYAQTAVDKALVVKRYENAAHGSGKLVAHSERFTAPVAGRSQLF